MSRPILVVAFALLTLLCARPALAQTAAPAAPIVVDASRFVGEIAKGHVIRDAASLGVPWVFNNLALQMRTNHNYVIRTEVPAAGHYHLYARTHGDSASGFRVALGDRVVSRKVGNAPMRFERVGEMDLPRGPVDVRLMRIEGRPTLDVIVLSTRADLREEELVALQLHPDVKLLREYPIPRSSMVKFGDVDGDGRTDFVVFSPGYSAHVFTFDGTKRWSWDAPAEGERLRAEFEAPGALWDLDGDGKAEVIHWREIDGREWLVAADGMTGAIKHRTPWPTRAMPHVFNNFRRAKSLAESTRYRPLSKGRGPTAFGVSALAAHGFSALEHRRDARVPRRRKPRRVARDSRAVARGSPRISAKATTTGMRAAQGATASDESGATNQDRTPEPPNPRTSEPAPTTPDAPFFPSSPTRTAPSSSARRAVPSRRGRSSGGC